MPKKIDYIVALTTGVIVGILPWAIATRLFGITEIYNTPAGSYVALSLPTLFAFYIALKNGLSKALVFMLGVYLGTVFYPYFFGNGEQKVWIGLGSVMAFAHLFYAFVAAFAGWIARVIYLRFFDKHATQVTQKIMAKMDDLAQRIPDTAHETYTYTQKASHAGYTNLIFALLFAAVGAVTYAYPSPPFNPIEMPILQTAAKWIGSCFMLIGLYELIISMRLMTDKSAWRIVIDDRYFLYETPKSTREKSFSCNLDEIEKIEKIIIAPDDDTLGSDSGPAYNIVLKNGQTYPLFGGRNYIDEQRCIDALRARGVRLVEKYLTGC